MGATDYVFAHRQAPPAAGLVVAAADFGTGEGGGGGGAGVNVEEAIARFEAIQAECDRDNLRHTEVVYPKLTWTKQQIFDNAMAQIAFAKDLQASQGVIWEHAQVGLDSLKASTPGPGPSPPPGPGPVPAPDIACVIGTYNGHGLARDAYGGYREQQVQWGPHHGLPLVAPADGRVEVYSFGTPLGPAEALGDAYQYADEYVVAYGRNYYALWHGWVCWVGPEQTMYVAVFWPSAPLTIEGQRVGHLHYGHVHQSIKAGPISKGEQFATVWDSGIRFEPGVPNARAAHTHCCAGAGTQLSPNGDLPGRLAAVAQGWTVTDIGFVPGPSEYQSGQYCAGRKLSDFQQAGKPIPPLPG